MRNVFGGLGLVALLMAIVVGTLAAFGTFGAKSSTSSTIVDMEAVPEEQTTQGGQATPATSIGQAVTLGDVSWTVTDASKKSELHRYTFPPKTTPGNFVSVDFTVENVSNQPVTLTDEVIALFDSQGNEYRPAADRNDAYVENDKNLLFNEEGLLEPGETKEGEVNFQVLPNSSGFKVRLEGTNPNANEERYVNLGS